MCPSRRQEPQIQARARIHLGRVRQRRHARHPRPPGRVQVQHVEARPASSACSETDSEPHHRRPPATCTRGSPARTGRRRLPAQARLAPARLLSRCRHEQVVRHRPDYLQAEQVCRTCPVRWTAWLARSSGRWHCPSMCMGFGRSRRPDASSGSGTGAPTWGQLMEEERPHRVQLRARRAGGCRPTPSSSPDRASSATRSACNATATAHGPSGTTQTRRWTAHLAAVRVGRTSDQSRRHR